MSERKEDFKRDLIQVSKEAYTPCAESNVGEKRGLQKQSSWATQVAQVEVAQVEVAQVACLPQMPATHSQKVKPTLCTKLNHYDTMSA